MILDGFDMLPVLTGGSRQQREEMFWDFREEQGGRVGTWKWVRSGRGGGLFDLATDLGETRDLSRDRPEVLQRVQREFAAWRAEMDGAEIRGPFRDY